MKMPTTEHVVTMFSYDGKRSADIKQDLLARTFKVLCYIDGSLHLTVDCRDKSYYWAQDVAENFVSYIGSFSKNSC
jgi:hypothetical protein